MKPKMGGVEQKLSSEGLTCFRVDIGLNKKDSKSVFGSFSFIDKCVTMG
jgi:hypothetical protein